MRGPGLEPLATEKGARPRAGLLHLGVPLRDSAPRVPGRRGARAPAGLAGCGVRGEPRRVPERPVLYGW